MVLLFALVGGLGFLTFGSASSGLILNNYSGKDALMSLSRVSVALSIVFLYPLVFVAIAGVTLGNALIYPSLMFRSAVKAMGEKASKGLKREVPFAMFSAGLGVAMGCVGAKMALGML